MRYAQAPGRAFGVLPWVLTAGTATVVGLLAADPALLVPVARGYQALCERYPPLARLTVHLPPLPVALLLLLMVLALVTGGATGMRMVWGTLRFNRRLQWYARPMPARLERAAKQMGLVDRLTYIDHQTLAAFCYGFLRPRVAVTSSLLVCLDDEELVAVLAHERHHLRRRDPARYLGFHMLAAAAFMFPVAPAIRQRLETRAELAADRSALAVVPRGALAGALLAVLAGGEATVIGAAGLTATEARIAHLAGAPVLPPIPVRAAVASTALLVVIGAAVVDLATTAHLVRMVCELCSSAI